MVGDQPQWLEVRAGACVCLGCSTARRASVQGGVIPAGSGVASWYAWCLWTLTLGGFSLRGVCEHAAKCGVHVRPGRLRAELVTIAAHLADIRLVDPPGVAPDQGASQGIVVAVDGSARSGEVKLVVTQTANEVVLAITRSRRVDVAHPAVAHDDDPESGKEMLEELAGVPISSPLSRAP